MIKFALTIALAIPIAFTNIASAQTIVDFEDIAAGTTFGVGSTITSNGFDILITGSSGGGTRIVGQSSANFQSGNSLFNAGNRQLSFQLTESTQRVSFLFENSGGTNFLTVNGETSPFVFDFNVLDGSTLGGVEIETIGDQAFGELSLTGPINSLIVSGQELGLDNIAIGVPEPTSGTLLGGLLAAAFLRRKRNVAG